MNQQDFEARHREEWARLDEWLTLSARKRPADDDFPRRYRGLCQQLALARKRRYSSGLVAELNALVLRAHHLLYAERASGDNRWLHFLRAGFPQALRSNARLVWLATALFVVPGLALAFACHLDSDMIFSVMSADEVRSFEAMYDPANDRFGRERGAGTDLTMFGYYIKNNIGVSFRTFAGGILMGLGSAFFLLYNGVMIGAVAGHLNQAGLAQTFFPCVIGHGAFELTAIVFSGAAGLKLGGALIDPAGLRRIEALRLAAREAIVIMYGAFVMLVIAAFIEAFWSASAALPEHLKYSVGGALWLLVIVYCLFSGRRDAA